MTLVDTSVWIDHFRSGSSVLGEMLGEDRVLVHPFVVGELSCGALRDRAQILDDLATLPIAIVADPPEVMRLVTDRKLWGKGIGWVDCHLLASAVLSGCTLWTLDTALHRVAAALRIACA